ncbi:cytochrome P450, partial [Suillus americanus]
RKSMHQIISNRAALGVYHPIEEIETCRFLKRVLLNLKKLRAHVRHIAGAIILRISHGYEVKENNDPFIDLADRAMDQFSRSAAPGAFTVDIMPFLANFKTREDMVSTPWLVKDQTAAGIAPTSFTSNLLEGRTLSAEEDPVVMWSAAFLNAGGADTIVSPIYAYFLAMTLFPDVEKKAQAEIDAVIATLPYTEALVKEIYRWNVVGPTAIPHRVSEDDIRDGHYIPKGSLVIANIWFMLNDSRTYANPSQFNPERFLDNNGKNAEPDPRKICFSFCICPGTPKSCSTNSILTLFAFMDRSPPR